MKKLILEFSSFLLLKENDKEDKISQLVDENSFIMFFKAKNHIFATGEDGRMTYAQIKNPDDGPISDANLIAINLSKALKGELEEKIFNKDELDNIKIISSDEAKKILNKSKEIDVDKIKTNLKREDS